MTNDWIPPTDGKYWSARELGPLLGYSSWRSFENQVKLVKIACEKINLEVAAHVKESVKIVATAKRGQRKLKDYLLSPYVCYLIASNSDGNKPEVAKAQLYFSKVSTEKP